MSTINPHTEDTETQIAMATNRNRTNKIVVFDLEIRQAIPDRNGGNEPGIKYCGGWSDHAGMGISVICAYDYSTDRYRTFLKDNFGQPSTTKRTAATDWTPFARQILRSTRRATAH